MASLHRSPLAFLCATNAVLAIAACGLPACAQTYTTVTIPPQGTNPGRVTIDREIQLGNDYLSGHGVNKDEKQAAYWYEKAADAGNPWAQKQIGFLYQAGIGVPADAVRAVHWYQLAAAGGVVSAKTNLGVAYLWGSGVPKDAAMAALLFREAAEKGDGRAAAYLGDVYCLGIGVKQDKAAAERWYMVGAKRHDPLAEFDLGMLFSVEDHPHDFEKAAKWLRKSMAGGYVPAMHSLALLLQAHPDLGKSDREFLSLFEQASGYGQWRSSHALGILYRDGLLIRRDPAAAYYYLELAVLQAGDAVPKSLSSMLQELSTETGSEVAKKQEAAARDWYRQHPDRIELLIKDHRNGAEEGLAIAAPLTGFHAGQILQAPAS